MTSGQLHVVPSKLGHWIVLDEHGRLHSTHPTQTDAERSAHDFATHSGVGEILLHDRYHRTHRVDPELQGPAPEPVSTDPPAAPSYHALRISAGTSAIEWLRQARTRQEKTPLAILALLAGRTRVEVTADEAAEAIEWAACLPGWNPNHPPPLTVHVPSVAAGGTRPERIAQTG
jgi:hypothetical protein